jgi:hypothetical protein
MLEFDKDILKQSLNSIRKRHSPEQEESNPYNNPKRAQQKCKHVWSNGTDAIYFGNNGKRVCAICKKVF